MLTAQELHIEVNLSFQKIGSDIYQKFLPEEIDWLLNKNMERFISSKVKLRKDGSGGYSVDETSLDDIRSIEEKDVVLPAFVDPISGKTFSYLPSDYLYLLADRSKILTDCNPSFSTNTQDYTEYVNILNFLDSPRTSAPYYSDLAILINNVEQFDIRLYNISAGLSSKNQKYVLIHLIISELTKAGYRVYWESYGSIYNKNSFIIVQTTTDTVSMRVDGLFYLGAQTINTNKVFTALPEKVSNNRLTSTGILYDILYNNVHYATDERSPVSNMSKDILYVFYSKRFIIASTVIDYIRKPQPISLILGQGCELPEPSAMKVCDMTVEYMLNITASPNYQAKLNDNLVRME